MALQGSGWNPSGLRDLAGRVGSSADRQIEKLTGPSNMCDIRLMRSVIWGHTWQDSLSTWFPSGPSRLRTRMYRLGSSADHRAGPAGCSYSIMSQDPCSNDSLVKAVQFDSIGRMASVLSQLCPAESLDRSSLRSLVSLCSLSRKPVGKSGLQWLNQLTGMPYLALRACRQCHLKVPLSSAELRREGIRADDGLTRGQQKQRQALSHDFQVLTNKGYKPFFRGSQLKYYKERQAG